MGDTACGECFRFGRRSFLAKCRKDGGVVGSGARALGSLPYLLAGRSPAVEKETKRKDSEAADAGTGASKPRELPTQKAQIHQGRGGSLRVIPAETRTPRKTPDISWLGTGLALWILVVTIVNFPWVEIHPSGLSTHGFANNRCLHSHICRFVKLWEMTSGTFRTKICGWRVAKEYLVR